MYKLGGLSIKQGNNDALHLSIPNSLRLCQIKRSAEGQEKQTSYMVEMFSPIESSSTESPLTNPV